MKNLFKTSVVAMVIAATFPACFGNKPASGLHYS